MTGGGAIVVVVLLVLAMMPDPVPVDTDRRWSEGAMNIAEFRIAD